VVLNCIHHLLARPIDYDAELLAKEEREQRDHSQRANRAWPRRLGV